MKNKSDVKSPNPYEKSSYKYDSDRRAELRNNPLKDFNIKSQANNSLGVIEDNLTHQQHEEIDQLFPLFSDLEALLMNFEEYQKLVKEECSTNRRLKN